MILYIRMENQSGISMSFYFIERTDNLLKALDYELCENNFDEFDTSEEGVEYNKRSLCYDEIWKMFSNYLYDEDSVTYISLFGWYDAEPLMKFEYYVKEKREKEGFI